MRCGRDGGRIDSVCSSWLFPDLVSMLIRAFTQCSSLFLTRNTTARHGNYDDPRTEGYTGLHKWSGHTTGRDGLGELLILDAD